MVKPKTEQKTVCLNPENLQRETISLEHNQKKNVGSLVMYTFYTYKFTFGQMKLRLGLSKELKLQHRYMYSELAVLTMPG